MIVLGFDFGMKYIGIAVGQTVTRTATPITALIAKDGIPHFEEITALIQEWRPDILVVGIPLNMDGTEQPITFAARRFSKRLQARYTLPVHAVDERLSSWEAKERLKNSARGKSATKFIHSTPGSQKPRMTKKAKEDFKTLNAMAAAVLVEQWISENV